MQFSAFSDLLFYSILVVFCISFIFSIQLTENISKMREEVFDYCIQCTESR